MGIVSSLTKPHNCEQQEEMAADDNSSSGAAPQPSKTTTETRLGGAKGPRQFLSVNGRGFNVGQKVIWTDKKGKEWKGYVKEHTKADVTPENADKVKMVIYVPEKEGVVFVTYQRVRDEKAPAEIASDAEEEEDGEEEAPPSPTPSKRASSRLAAAAEPEAKRWKEAGPPVTMFEAQQLIDAAVAEKAQESLSALQETVARLVQEQVSKGAFEPGTQMERLQKENRELSARVVELERARHVTGLDRRALRNFVGEWCTALENAIGGLLERVEAATAEEKQQEDRAEGSAVAID